jgi:hypothetical protein
VLVGLAVGLGTVLVIELVDERNEPTCPKCERERQIHMDETEQRRSAS